MLPSSRQSQISGSCTRTRAHVSSKQTLKKGNRMTAGSGPPASLVAGGTRNSVVRSLEPGQPPPNAIVVFIAIEDGRTFKSSLFHLGLPDSAFPVDDAALATSH